MFIVWRRRPVKGQGGGPFLTQARVLSGDRHPWKPIRCEHRGTSRVAWTPLVMLSERRDGKPRQRVLERLPTIRTCCIADGFCRAAWWYEVELAMVGWAESDVEPMGPLLSRDKPAMLAKLREVVPRPTRPGLAAFNLVKEDAERREKEWWSAYFDEQRAKSDEFLRRREAEDRAKAEAGRRYRERSARDPFGEAAGPDGFADLGLGPDATVDQVKARYRELAKRHHPDRGGDDAEFVRVTRAYERAMRTLAEGATA